MLLRVNWLHTVHVLSLFRLVSVHEEFTSIRAYYLIQTRIVFICFLVIWSGILMPRCALKRVINSY